MGALHNVSLPLSPPLPPPLLPLLSLLPLTVSTRNIAIPHLDTMEDPGVEAVLPSNYRDDRHGGNERLLKILKRKHTNWVVGKSKYGVKKPRPWSVIGKVFEMTPNNRCPILDENGRCRELFTIKTQG